MRRFRISTAWFAAATLCAAVLYGIPTLLEMVLLHRTGAVTEVMVGDLFGCLILALGNWKKGFALYLVLTLVELLLVSARVIRPAQVVWVTDSVPAILLSVSLLGGARTFASAAAVEDDFPR
jgi:hypothetical protein